MKSRRLPRQLLPAVVMGIALAAAGGLRPVEAEGPRPVSPGRLDSFTLASGRCPTFSWTATEGARGYEIVVQALAEAGWSETTPPAPVVRTVVPGGASSWTPARSDCLEPGGHYAWLVRALGAGAGDPWSEPSFFSVVRAPSADELADALAVVRRHEATRELDEEPAAASSVPDATPAWQSAGGRRSAPRLGARAVGGGPTAPGRPASGTQGSIPIPAPSFHIDTSSGVALHGSAAGGSYSLVGAAAPAGTDAAGTTVRIVAGGGDGTGSGGEVEISAGVGGAKPAGGGGIGISAGDAGAGSDGDGGSVTMSPGAGDGTGMDGVISLGGRSVLVPGFFSVTECCDGNPTQATITPDATYMEVSCNDPDSCGFDIDEAGALPGQLLVLVNAGSFHFVVHHPAGATHLPGATDATLDPNDSLTLIYATDRWVGTALSDNS